MIFDDMGQFAGKTDATTSLFFNPLQICGPFKRPLDTPVGLLLGKEPVCKSQILSPATVQCHQRQHVKRGEASKIIWFGGFVSQMSCSELIRQVITFLQTKQNISLNWLIINELLFYGITLSHYFHQTRSCAALQAADLVSFSFRYLSGVTSDLQDTAWESDHFSSLTRGHKWPSWHSMRKWSFFVTYAGSQLTF